MRIIKLLGLVTTLISFVQSLLTITLNCGDTNCLLCSFDLTTLKCLQCEKGFSLVNNQCEVSICNQQVGGYLANQFQSNCSQCHAACKYCISDSYSDCTECNDGYYGVPSPKGSYLRTCLPCQSPGCQKCDNQGNCMTCLPGLVKNAQQQCTECTIKFALTCSSSTDVDSCIPGFVKSDDGKSCVTQNSQCEIGSYVNNQMCTDCPQQCIQCNNTGSCLICNEGFYVNNNGQCGQCPPKCDSCMLDPQSKVVGCTDCKPEYFLSKTRTSDTTGQCLEVENNYITCPKGQFTNKYANTCVRCPNNCLECSQFGDQCLVCYDQINYQLDSGQCKQRCSSSNYQKYTQNDSDMIKQLYFSNSPLAPQTAITSNNCSNSCGVSNCQKCMFDATFCQVCKENYNLNNDGSCSKICPPNTFNSKYTQNKCLPCPKGCVECDYNSCKVCNSNYILKDGACFNDSISTSFIQNSVMFDGHWMVTCPLNTYQIGKTCIPSSSCVSAQFSIQAKVALCSKCQDNSKIVLDSNGSTSPPINIPDIEQEWMGKCYETCPAFIDNQNGNKNKLCSNQCDSKQSFINWTKDSGCAVNCLQNIQSKIIQGCNTYAVCGDGKYASVPAIVQKGIQVDPLLIFANFCKPCPPGCSKCIYNGSPEPVCLLCAPNYEMYLTYSIQDPTSYNFTQKANFKYIETKCIQQNSNPQIKCTGMVGYFFDKLNVFSANACLMCTSVNPNNGCSQCPDHSITYYKDPQNYDCVPYCLENQIQGKLSKKCYDKPTITLSVNFNSFITADGQKINIPNGSNSFSVQAVLTAVQGYDMELTQIQCSIALPSLKGNQFQITPTLPTMNNGQKITHTFNLLDPTFLLTKLNANGSYTLNCSFNMKISDSPGDGFTLNSSTLVNSLTLPSGNLLVSSKLTDNAATAYTLNISNWCFQPLKQIPQYNSFNYQISVVAKNSKNLSVTPTTFPIDTITKETYPKYFTLNSKGYQSFFYTFNFNVQNGLFNSFSVVLTVQSTVSDLSNLSQTVSQKLNYTFTQPSNPKNPQSQIFNQVLNTNVHQNGKQEPNMTAMQNVANNVYSYRGDMPTNQEISQNLTLNKQSMMANKYYFPVSCSDSQNCSGNGKCKKIKQNNWYSMCDCNSGYTGEQCNWSIGDMTSAKKLVNVYLNSINDNMRSLDPNGNSSQGLEQRFLFISIIQSQFILYSQNSVNQMLTLLQLWTDQRDVFSRQTFETLMNIFATDTFKKYQNQTYNERILYILDNMIDIIRNVDLPDQALTQNYRQITQQISSVSQQLINQINLTNTTSYSLNRSNYKGILIHNKAFSNLKGSYYNLSLTNSMQFAIPKVLVKDGQYIEIILKPMDLSSPSSLATSTTSKMTKNVLSNPLTITVRDLNNGCSINVTSILADNPVIFNMTFAIPSTYIKQMKNITCTYWDEQNQDWLSEGVALSSKYYSDKIVQSIQCSASHLTEFSLINIDHKNTTIPDTSDETIASLSSSACKLYVIIYLGVVITICFISYVVSLFTQNNIVTFKLKECLNEKQSASQILQGILPDLIFGGENMDEDAVDQDVAIPRSNLQLQEHRQTTSDNLQKMPPLQHKNSQKIPLSSPSPPIPLLQGNMDTNPNQFTNMNAQNFSQISANSNSQQYSHQRSISNSISSDQKQQQNQNLLSKIQYLNDIPASPTNVDISRIAPPKPSYFSNVAKFISQKFKMGHKQPNQMNYPTDYQRPANQLVVTQELTFNHNLDDKNMVYIYKNQKMQSQANKNIPTIIEESVGHSENPNQNSPQKRRKRNVNPKTVLNQANLQQFFKSSPESDNKANFIQDLESKSNANSGEPMVRQKDNSLPSNPPGDLLLIDNAPRIYPVGFPSPVKVDSTIKPYLTIFSWKYSFKRYKNTDRVLYCVTLMSIYLFSASFYFQYFNVVKNRSITARTLAIHTSILWITFEILNWALIAFIHVRNAFINIICCNAARMKWIQILFKLFHFLFAFSLYFFVSALIIMKHSDKSVRFFILWISTFTINAVINIILEIILMKLVQRYKMVWLFLIIKAKRMDI